RRNPLQGSTRARARAPSPPSARPAARRRAGCARGSSFRQALLEAGDEDVLRQVLADEHQDRFLRLVLRPGLAHVAAHHHVHALEDDAARVALHPQHALVAQQVGAVDLDHAGEEGLQLLAVERLLRAVDERRDLVVVLVVRVGEEVGFEREDRVQVEAADVEHLVDRRVAEIDFLDRCPRIHLLQPLRQGFNFAFRNQIGLRHQYPVGEAHLLLRLVEFVELLRRMLGVDQGDDRVEQVVVPISSSVKKVCATGPGSAMPVVSITTRSNLSLPSSRFSLSVPRMRMRSPRTVQQMQPLFISTICSSPVSMISLSTPISPNSFSITAMRWPWSSFRIRLSSVVLPLPRNPVRIVTGTMLLSSMTAPGEGRDYRSTPNTSTKPNQGQTTFISRSTSRVAPRLRRSPTAVPLG